MHGWPRRRSSSSSIRAYWTLIIDFFLNTARAYHESTKQYFFPFPFSSLCLGVERDNGPQRVSRAELVAWYEYNHGTVLASSS